MGDLLAADFARLIKSQIFKGVIIFCVESLVFEVIISYFNKNLSKDYMDALLNTNFLVFGILLSVFIGLFIGSEYSDGTMRNKLVAGNSRTAIYISNLITCVLGGFILQMVNYIELNIISVALFGFYKPPAQILPSQQENMVLMRAMKIAEKQTIALYIIIAYTAVFLLVTMLVCSKSGGTAAVMALALVILAAGMTIDGQVSSYNPKTAKETTEQSESIQYQDPIAQYQSGGFGRRKKELSGDKLKIYLFLDDLLPASQAQNLTKLNVPKNASKYVLYDLSTAGLATVFGIILFRNKDLK